jgi:hypothetical protein
MPRTGALTLGLFATLLGGALALVGVLLAIQAGVLASGGVQEHPGFLGLGGGRSESASIPTAPWVGLVLAVAGLGMVGFGLRGMMDAAD